MSFKGSTPPRPSKRSGLGIDFPGAKWPVSMMPHSRAFAFKRTSSRYDLHRMYNSHSKQMMPTHGCIRYPTKAQGLACLAIPKGLHFKSLGQHRALSVQVLVLSQSTFPRHPPNHPKRILLVLEITRCKKCFDCDCFAFYIFSEPSLFSPFRQASRTRAYAHGLRLWCAHRRLLVITLYNLLTGHRNSDLTN